MKKIKDISIKVKLPLFIGGISFLVLSMIGIVLVISIRSRAEDNATQIVQLEAQDEGRKLAERINSAGSVIRAFSGILEQIVVSDFVSAGNKRELVLRELGLIVKKELRIGNIWCIYEPNALDSLDSRFINRMGSDGDGRFCPWLSNDSKGFRSAILEDAYSTYAYRQVKVVRKEIITEPYVRISDGKKEMIFSICIPIIVKGRFIGAIGTDFNSSEMAHNMTLSKEMLCKLITDRGTIALSFEPAEVGMKAENGNQEIIDRFSHGKMFDGFFPSPKGMIYKVFMPIQLGEDTLPWYYKAEISRKEVYKVSREVVRYLVAGMIIGMVLIGLSCSVLVGSLLKAIVTVTDNIHKLSLGHIHMIHLDYDKTKKDEIGQMNGELEELVVGLKRTSDFARNIGEGNLAAGFEPLSDEDVLGNSLLEMRENLSKAEEEEKRYQIEEEQRNWGTTGIARFADILRKDNNNMENLSYNIISSLVKYIDANQGGIFILNDESGDLFLEMKACFAFDRKKFAEKQIMPGEGLVGTCFLEGEPIYMTDLPEGYITITSGLGDDTPRALLVTPLKVNNEIYGVIELASFKPFEPYKLDFISKVSESIAATISSVKVNIQTNQLLEKTKIQAEEMANQEEELRQNMEEMQTTQEEMRRREAELSEALGKMEALQKESSVREDNLKQLYDSVYSSFNVVNFSAEGDVVDINEMAIHSFENGTKENMIGVPISSFIDDYEDVLVSMRMGRNYEAVQTIQFGTEKKRVKNLFVPFMGTDNSLIGFIVISYFIE